MKIINFKESLNMVQTFRSNKLVMVQDDNNNWDTSKEQNIFKVLCKTPKALKVVSLTGCGMVEGVKKIKRIDIDSKQCKYEKC